MLLARRCTAVTLAAALCAPGLAACTPAASAPTPTTPLSRAAPPTACSFLTLADARKALGTAADPRREPSTTADSRTFCTFRATTGGTELVVLAANGGPAAFEHELSQDEQDLGAGRRPITGLADGYLISGTELAAAKVIVGVRRGPLWLTVSLQVAGAKRTTLETRAIVAVGVAVRRLSG